MPTCLNSHFSQWLSGAWFRCLHVGISAYETSPWSGQVQVLGSIQDLQETQSLLDWQLEARWDAGMARRALNDLSVNTAHFISQWNLECDSGHPPAEAYWPRGRAGGVALLSLRLCFCVWLYDLWIYIILTDADREALTLGWMGPRRRGWWSQETCGIPFSCGSSSDSLHLGRVFQYSDFCFPAPKFFRARYKRTQANAVQLSAFLKYYARFKYIQISQIRLLLQ